MAVAALDCKACGGEKTMSRAEPLRMSPIVAVIGRILLAPAMLGIAAGLVVFVAALARGNAMAIEMTGQTTGTMGTAVGIAFFGLGLAVSSLVGGLLGFVLVMRRKVWKCSACGAVLDRD